MPGAESLTHWTTKSPTDARLLPQSTCGAASRQESAPSHGQAPDLLNNR